MIKRSDDWSYSMIELEEEVRKVSRIYVLNDQVDSTWPFSLLSDCFQESHFQNSPMYYTSQLPRGDYWGQIAHSARELVLV